MHLQGPNTFLIYLHQLFDALRPINEKEFQELDQALNSLADGPIARQHEALRQSIEIIGNLPEAPELAFKIGHHIPITAFIPLANPIRFAPTIQEMLWFISRYYQLQAPLIALRYTNQSDTGHLSLDFTLPVSTKAESFAIATSASILNYELSHITGIKRNIAEVHLRRECSAYEKHYKKNLGILPKLRNNTNSILLRPETLLKTNPRSDPVTFGKYIEVYESELAKSSQIESATTLVKNVVSTRISNPPMLAQVAKLLNITERKLRLLLTKENTSYRNILQDSRRDFAIEKLKNCRLPISQIAYELGYSDPSAFNHSFKRWTGKSPTDYQNMQKEA